MITLPMIDMHEATRLTREGRLQEAMALLRGARAPAPQNRRQGAAMADGNQDGSILDMQPPTTASGVWSSPISDSLRIQTAGPKTRAGRTTGGINPAALPGGATFEDRRFADHIGARTYKLYVPSGYAGQPLPLVVMLHGCTQSPDDFAAGTQMNAIAEEQLFFVAYPAQPQSANAQKCWNWFNPGDQRRDQGEPALIAGITRQIMCEFLVEEGRVFIAGLSAGGAAAANIASVYPDLYVAVGIHSGLACGAAMDMPSAFTAMRQGGKGKRVPQGAQILPTIVFHGDRDGTVNAVNGDEVISQSKGGSRLSVDVSRGQAAGGISYTRTVHHDADGKPVLEQWLLHGAGHAWSGGSPAASYTEPRGPDASREMMRFFLQRDQSGG
jgi:poly(hydroxyalkanoate) depolymerase family esterase